MAVLIKLIQDYSVWLYGAIAIIAVFLLRAAILARREVLQATFTLEKEAARNREYRILGGAALLLVLIAAVYGVNRYVAPNVEIPSNVVPSPSPIFLPTITPTPATPTPTPTATPTLERPTRPVPTEEPTPPPATPTPAVIPPNCPNPNARLTWPGLRAQVHGVVQVTGSASIDGFQFYKVELGVGESPTEWSFLFSGERPVVDGVLGQWDTSPLPEGIYSLRLTVVDLTGNYPSPCQTVVQVVK